MTCYLCCHSWFHHIGMTEKFCQQGLFGEQPHRSAELRERRASMLWRRTWCLIWMFLP